MSDYKTLLKPEELSNSSDPIISEDFPDLKDVIDQMKEMVLAHNGVALAGPQVGFNKQLFVVRQPGKSGAWDVCINPKIKPLKKAGRRVGDEGCLSFPGLIYRVLRWNVIKVTWSMPLYSKETGEVVAMRTVTNDLGGGWARIAQHEIDHLHGKTVESVGEVVDLKKSLKEAAERAGIVYDEEKGKLFTTDPETGALIPANLQEVMLEVREKDEKESIKVAKKEAWEQRQSEKQRRDKKRKRQREARRENRRKGR